MKIFKAGEVETRPFVPESFTKNEDNLSSMEIIASLRRGSSKKSIRNLAKKRGLDPSEKEIRFAKKMIKILLDEIE